MLTPQARDYVALKNSVIRNLVKPENRFTRPQLSYLSQSGQGPWILGYFQIEKKDFDMQVEVWEHTDRDAMRGRNDLSGGSVASGVAFWFCRSRAPLDGRFIVANRLRGPDRVAPEQ